MYNQQNPSWRSLWTIDLESATATHRDGWAFKFSLVDGETGVFKGECVAQPSPLNKAHMAQASRIAKEAGDIYIEARNARH